MITFASYAPPAFAANRPAGSPVKFGSCVNANTQKAEFQNMLLLDSLNMRLHAIASAGMTGRQDFTEVLSKLLLRQETDDFKVSQISNNIQVNEFTLGALLEAAGKNPALKPEILETLKKAKKARHLAAMYRTIDDAIKKLEGHAPASAKLTQIQQAMEANRQHRVA